MHKNIFRGLILVRYMRHMYSRLCEYRKIFLAKYLCIGFVPGGTVRSQMAITTHSSLAKRVQFHLRHRTPKGSDAMIHVPDIRFLAFSENSLFFFLLVIVFMGVFQFLSNNFEGSSGLERFALLGDFLLCLAMKKLGWIHVHAAMLPIHMDHVWQRMRLARAMGMRPVDPPTLPLLRAEGAENDMCMQHARI